MEMYFRAASRYTCFYMTILSICVMSCVRNSDHGGWSIYKYRYCSYSSSLGSLVAEIDLPSSSYSPWVASKAEDSTSSFADSVSGAVLIPHPQRLHFTTNQLHYGDNHIVLSCSLAWGEWCSKTLNVVLTLSLSTVQISMDSSVPHATSAVPVGGICHALDGIGGDTPGQAPLLFIIIFLH